MPGRFAATAVGVQGARFALPRPISVPNRGPLGSRAAAASRDRQETPLPVQFQIVIFAVIAAVVLFQLYNVLGKRVGRQPQEDARAALLRHGDDDDE